jgi:hypothetical protein
MQCVTPMEKKLASAFILFNLILVLIVGWFWTRMGKNSSQNPAPSSLPQVTSLPSPRPLSSENKEIYQAPRRLPLNEDTGSSACRAYWKALSELDLNTAFHYPPNPEQKLPAPEGCQETPPALHSLHAQADRACKNLYDFKNPLTKEAWIQAAESCQSALFHYRAGVTNFATKDLEAKNIHDPKIALDKMFASFESDPAKSAEMAERLMELRPDFQQAAMASVIGRFLDAFKNAPARDAERGNDPRWEKTENALRRAREMVANDDFQMVEAEVLIATRGLGSTGASKEHRLEKSRRIPSSGNRPLL